jgi:hypothetical protein
MKHITSKLTTIIAWSGWRILPFVVFAAACVAVGIAANAIACRSLWTGVVGDIAAVAASSLPLVTAIAIASMGAGGWSGASLIARLTAVVIAAVCVAETWVIQFYALKTASNYVGNTLFSTETNIIIDSAFMGFMGSVVPGFMILAIISGGIKNCKPGNGGAQ